ncbi:MAG: hypothetical protein K2W96_27450, partial [Gemmataceae bacterium]|nr:hypothetical protein [Gemmataceae bacterium]
MSFDMTFHPRPGTTLTRAEFNAYFAGAEDWSLDGAEANYHNEDTGVYFHLSHREPDAGAAKGKAAEEGGGPRLWFSINFCRPRFFGREARSVLAGVADDLGLMIHAEDGEAIEDGEELSEEMLRQWNQGNDWACRAILAMSGTTGLHPVPAKVLEECWLWTYQREQYAQGLFEAGSDVFVPRVMWLLHEGRAKSLAVWPNLLPTAIPKVDLVYVGRNEMPAGKKGRRTKPALVPWDEVRKAMKGYKVKKDAPLPYLLLDFGRAEDAPEEAARYVHGLEPVEGKLEGLSPDKLLDEEEGKNDNDEDDEDDDDVVF